MQAGSSICQASSLPVPGYGMVVVVVVAVVAVVAVAVVLVVLVDSWCTCRRRLRWDTLQRSYTVGSTILQVDTGGQGSHR